MELELRTDDDYGTTGIVDAFSEQVLTEPALFTLEHVTQGAQGAFVRTGEGPAPAAVVEEGVHAEFLLEHGMIDMIVERRQLKETLSTLVAHF